jgi:UPF0755 protein
MRNSPMPPQGGRSRKGKVAHGTFYALWRVLRTVLIYLISISLIVVAIALGYRHVKENYLDPVSTSDHTPVQVVIPKGSGKSTIAGILEENGLIRSKSVFKLYVDILGYASKMKAGTYVMDPTMDYRAILDKLSQGDGKGDVTNFIVIEGYTVEQMAQRLFKDQHIADVGEFEKLCNSTDDVSNIAVIIEMMEGIPEETLAQRKYALEGYLFPAKYEIYSDAQDMDLILKMVNKMNSIFNEERRARAKEMGMTVDQVITLASMIEKEGKPADFAKVSAVFHNRLDKDMKLQSDPTVKYVLGTDRIALTSADTSVNSPYNTYLYKGLPVGPICSPSEKAIDAALYPDEEYVKDGYLYFTTKDPQSGELEFNTNLEDHEAAVEKYRPLWEAWDKQQEEAKTATTTPSAPATTTQSGQ